MAPAMGSRGAPSDAALAGVPRRAFELRADGAAWREALAGTELRAEPERRSSQVLIDSFDGRLADAGLQLARLSGERGVVCRLAETGSPEASAQSFELEREPVFVWDLPFERARMLAGVLEARALRRLGEHALDASCWAVLDDQRKIVARLSEELHELRPRAAREPVRIRRLVLQGVRGYDAELARLAELLGSVPGLTPVSEAHFDPWRQLRPPPRATARWPLLAPDVGAFEALARIARAQLAILRANGAGLLANEDAEFLHDARVALRRLRSLVSQLKGVLAPHAQQQLADELRWLASCTGAARDLDTLLFELRLTEPELRTELEPVVAALAAERERIQALLRADFRCERAAALRARLRAVFSGKGDPACAGPKAADPFTVLLARRLRRRFRQVAALAGRLTQQSPSEELHGLRISCKKLRYLLECCRGLVPKSELATAFQHLKGLQSVLGALQDSAVQAQLSRRLALELAGAAGARAHLALGQFLERLAQNGRAARARQAELTAEFLAPDSRAGFEAILRALERRRDDPR
jgi:CHAD domain-containing protein